MRKSAFNILMALALFTSCQGIDIESQKYGSISLALSSDIELDVTTKAGEDVNYADFIIDISGTTLAGAEYAHPQMSYGDMPQSITIPYGEYVVTAQSCTEEAAHSSNNNLGCVRYKGDQPVSVMNPQGNSVQVTCPMVNAKVSIIFDASFLEDFENPKAVVTMGNRSVQLLSEQVAYFNVAEAGTDLTYKVSGTIAGKTLTYTHVIEGLQPAKWAKVIIKSNHNGIIGAPDISVDEEMGDNAFTEEIDPDSGSEIVDGETGLPSIIVHTSLNSAVEIDCEIDVFN